MNNSFKNSVIRRYKKQLCAWYQKDRRIVRLSAVFGILFSVLFVLATASYSDMVQHGIANEVIRFHVLANSDSAEDQALKRKVRDGILEGFQPLLSASESYEETKQILSAHTGEIAAGAKKIVEENGYAYSVTAAVTKSKFPTKEYGDIVFPAGEYDALRIEIGEAQGDNWWCVMFPPLCYVDITQGEVTDAAKDDLKHILPEDAYEIVANTKASDDISVKVKFKIVEWWQEMKNAAR